MNLLEVRQEFRRGMVKNGERTRVPLGHTEDMELGSRGVGDHRCVVATYASLVHAQSNVGWGGEKK